MTCVRFIRAAACAALPLALGANVSAGAPPAMFRGNPAHTGVYDAPLGAAFAGQAWTFDAGSAVRATPTVSDGVVFIGTTGGTFYALDAATGTPKWSYDAKSAITSTAAVANGVAYVQTYDGRLLALDASSGNVRWLHASGPAARLAWGYEGFDYFVSSPAVADGVVYAGSADGNVYALDANDGHERWHAATGGRIRSSPAVEGALVVAGSWDGKLYGFDRATGRQIFAYATAGATLDSSQFGYDRRSIQSSPALANGVAYVGARDGKMYAVDATGSRRWTVDATVFWYPASPAVDAGLAFCGNSDGRFVQALALGDGAERWKFATASNVFASPAVDAGTVYAADYSGKLYALDEATGKPRWTWMGEGRRFESSPVPAGNKLIIASDDGTVAALNTAAQPLERAVFYDDSELPRRSWRAASRVKDYFADRDYRVLDDAGLATFLRAQIAARSRSVVVFAIDALPATLDEGANEGALLRDYLKSGGKAVWIGLPPGLFRYDPKTKDVDSLHPRRALVGALTSATFERGDMSFLSASPTPLGVMWGLRGRWIGRFGADPQSVGAVLAYDDEGNAAAWVTTFGGVPGSGFVNVPLSAAADGSPLNLDALQRAAEYFPG